MTGATEKEPLSCSQEESSITVYPRPFGEGRLRFKDANERSAPSRPIPLSPFPASQVKMMAFYKHSR